MRTFCSCCFLLTLFSCLTEQKIDPAQPETFVRYINGGNFDNARAMLKTPDGGYIILANTEVAATGLLKIKLVKTSKFGSVEWTQFYPPFSNSVLNYTGNGISLGTEGGYIITGEDIQNDRSKLLILVTDADGGNARTATLNPQSVSATDEVAGLAVSTGQNGNLVVLGNILSSSINNMILAEVNATTLSVVWDKAYGSSSSTLINKMFVDNSQEVIWSGTVTQQGNNNTDIRMVRAIPNSQNTKFDLNIGDPNLSESANDICKTDNGFAVVGSSDVTGKADRDIVFKRLSESGIVLSSRTIPATYASGIDIGQDDEGNSICQTSDKGFIILGTIVSSTSSDPDNVEVLGRGEKDYYLIKVNSFGEIEWTRAFGSVRDDVGVSVLQADDGGYVLLGTTRLANVATIALIKTNSLGEFK